MAAYAQAISAASWMMRTTALPDDMRAKLDHSDAWTYSDAHDWLTGGEELLLVAWCPILVHPSADSQDDQSPGERGKAPAPRVIVQSSMRVIHPPPRLAPAAGGSPACSIGR